MPTHSFAHNAAPQVSMSCVGLLYDASSNRTFRIPDVPATSTVAHIKQWYAKNVSGNTDPRTLVVIHNAQPQEDNFQVWQLAQGQGQFAVTVAHAKSPRAMLSLYVDTATTPLIPLVVSSDSTVLYVKQKMLEMLNLPLASAGQTTLIMPPNSTPLQNDLTLEACCIPNNARLSLSLQDNNSFQQQQQQQSPFGAQTQYSRIKEIWADAPNTDTNYGTQAIAEIMGVMDADVAIPPVSLVPMNTRSPPLSPAKAPQNQHRSGQKGRGGGRRQRSRSPTNASDLTSDQLQHLAVNFRTKMCRNGPSCKFGRNCWFAHNSEELRKPTDALPENLPAVHKLERYSHREANAAQARNGGA